MESIIQISDDFMNANTSFREPNAALKSGFASVGIIILQRRRHDFLNPETGADSNLLLMPAWYPEGNVGIKKRDD